jgi:uncharacterized protein
MHYHIILTERCNSQCKYCYEKSIQEFDNGLKNKWDFDLSSPIISEVSIEKLKKFLKPKDTLIFYGGEPLLEIEKIKKIMDNVNCEFCMQTNGKLLDKFPSEYLNKIRKILVSIDGSRERTDFNRGAGSYDLVLGNINLIKHQGFSGEIVARMTIAQNFPDVFEQVKNLIDLKIFDSVHWQIDAGFYKFDFQEERFKKFVEEYNKSISKLIDYWINEIKKGNVLRLYPFIGIVNSLIKNEKTKLRCGSGHSNYTITTNGNLVACPIMGCVKNFYCGNLESNKLKKIFVGEPCTSCYYLNICGGRCLYSNKAKLWPSEGEELICKTIKHLINELKKIFPSVKKLISENKIFKKDFEYEKYFGPEIIP